MLRLLAIVGGIVLCCVGHPIIGVLLTIVGVFSVSITRKG